MIQDMATLKLIETIYLSKHVFDKQVKIKKMTLKVGVLKTLSKVMNFFNIPPIISLLTELRF